MTINNLPKEHKSLVVARKRNGELWFWGSYDDESKAEDAATQIGGVVYTEKEYEVKNECK